jgi:hypothetical protein
LLCYLFFKSTFFFLIYILSMLAFFYSRCYFQSTFFTCQRFVPVDVFFYLLSFVPVSAFFHSTFCPIPHFSIQRLVPFAVFSFSVLSVDDFYCQCFFLWCLVGDSIVLSCWLSRLNSRCSHSEYNTTRSLSGYNTPNSLSIYNSQHNPLALLIQYSFTL